MGSKVVLKDKQLFGYTDSPFVEDIWFKNDLDDYFTGGNVAADSYNIVIPILYKINPSFATKRVNFLYRTRVIF